MTDKIGIQEIGVFIPPDRVSFEEKVQTWKLTSDFINEKTGFHQLARKKPSEKASDLAVKAFHHLKTKANIDPAQIELIVVVTQNPDHSIPHVSAVLQEKLRLPKTCMAFDISHGCAGYVYALSIVTSVMKNLGLRQSLLFTADPYSEIVDPNDRDTALLFGDAATATLITNEAKWQCGKFCFSSAPEKYLSLATVNGKLHMNGGEIFNFAAKCVPIEIQKNLNLNEKEVRDIGLFLVHSGSRYIVNTISKRAGIPREKIPFESQDYGNTISSSIPILLEKQMDIRENHLLICGFGVGLSCATTILSRPRSLN